MPTYAAKGTRRYSYYETRKDLARPDDPLSTRFGQGALDAHILHHLGALLVDEHKLRRLSNLDEADLLRCMFYGAKTLAARLTQSDDAQTAIQSLIAQIKVQPAHLELAINTPSLALYNSLKNSLDRRVRVNDGGRSRWITLREYFIERYIQSVLKNPREFVNFIKLLERADRAHLEGLAGEPMIIKVIGGLPD